MLIFFLYHSLINFYSMGRMSKIFDPQFNSVTFVQAHQSRVWNINEEASLSRQFPCRECEEDLTCLSPNTEKIKLQFTLTRDTLYWSSFKRHLLRFSTTDHRLIFCQILVGGIWEGGNFNPKKCKIWYFLTWSV